MKRTLLILLFLSSFGAHAQNSLISAEVKAFIIEKPELLEYCHLYLPSNHLECKEFNWAKVNGSEFHYSGKTWGYSTYRRFRVGSRMGKEGDYFDFAGGRLITLSLRKEAVLALDKKKITLSIENIYTMDGDVESKIRVVFVVSKFSGDKNDLKRNYPNLFQF